MSGPKPGELPPHGDRARYVSRQDPCRCGECKAANARYMREYRGLSAEPKPKEKKPRDRRLGPRLKQKKVHVPKGRAIPQHGTVSMYTLGCRCDACKAARADYVERYSKRPIKKHGLTAYVNQRCRCDVCKAAKRESRQRSKQYSKTVKK